MKSVFKKIIAHFLLVTFLVATTPHDLFHLFAGHIDTVDSKTTSTLVSERHVHCEVLQLSLPDFADSQLFQLPYFKVSVSQIYVSVKVITLPFFTLSPKGRAPPSFV